MQLMTLNTTWEKIIQIGRDYLNIAPKEQPPRNSQAKGPKTKKILERDSISQGVILSGTNTDGANELVHMNTIVKNGLKIIQNFLNL